MVNKKLQRCGLILLALPLVACAEVFQWTDQQGQPHYSDQAGNNAQKVEIDAPPTTYYQVEKVFDGDTILLSNGTKVRFLGINTPEVAGGRKTEEQGGQAAKVWLKQRLEHKKVSLQFDVENRINISAVWLMCLMNKNAISIWSWWKMAWRRWVFFRRIWSIWISF